LKKINGFKVRNSASVPPVSDVATVEGVPDLCYRKNRSVT
jgi:hypothetical protein